MIEDHLWIYLITISIAILLLIIIVALIIKFKRLKDQRNESDFIKKHFVIKNPKSPPVQTTKITKTGSLSPAESEEYLYLGSSKFNRLSTFNEDLLRPPTGLRDTVYSTCSSKSNSDADLIGDEPDGRNRRLLSVSGGQRSSASTTAHETEVTTIEFSLIFHIEECKLIVHVHNASNLPIQFRKNCSSYVKVSLKTLTKATSKSHKTKVVRNSLNPEYDAKLSFSKLTQQELKNHRIKLSVYAKSKTLTKRTLVGDLYVPLSRPDLEPGVQIRCLERISMACPDTGKKGPLLMMGSLGFLFVALEYHVDAGRLKVLIRKADNLPFTRRGTLASFGSAEFYAIVSLGCGGEVITYKETRPSVGANPVWNQPFLFYLEEDKLDQYYIQVLIMRGKFYTRDGAVGKVVIGAGKGTLSGQLHWAEIFESDHPEVSKWHEIQKMDNKCI